MQNIRILHPTNGTYVFGYVPEKKSKGLVIPGGPVFLKRGRDTPRGGFGAHHILGGHEHELRLPGTANATDVAGIVCVGSLIYCEFEHITKVKVTVVRDRMGAVVLQYIAESDTPHYSVVTAFVTSRRVGSRIGQIQASAE